MGWIKPRKPKDDEPTYYDLWAHEDPNSILGRHKMHVPAPKMKLPGHEESYNPPPEYLLSEEEVRSPREPWRKHWEHRSLVTVGSRGGRALGGHRRDQILWRCRDLAREMKAKVPQP